MAFPLTPTNGQVYTDTTTKRQWVYQSSISAWRLKERKTLSAYSRTDVTSTALAEGDVLVYNSANTAFKNTSAFLGDFDPLHDAKTTAPTSANIANAGEVWRDSTAETSYICSSYTAPSSTTVVSVASSTTSPYTITAGQRIAQSFTLNTAGTYNRLSIFSGSTGTFSFRVKIYSGTNVDGTPISTKDVTVNISATGPILLRLDDLVLSTGVYSWSVESLAGNGSFIVRRSTDTTYTSGAPVTGTGVVHTLTLLGFSLDWAFTFGYDLEVGYSVWVPIGTPSTYVGRVWRSSSTPPLSPMPDGQLWHNTANGVTYMWDTDASSWIHL